MIERLIIHDKDNVPIEWWAKSKVLDPIRELNFKPGLNIVWAKNGTGKSSVLTLIARMFHAEQGRYSTITHNSCQELFGNIKKLAGLPVASHDGQGIMHYNPNHKVGLFGGMAAFDDDFGAEGVHAIFAMKASSGEQILNEVGKLVLEAKKRKSTDPIWKANKTGGGDKHQRRVEAINTFFKPSIPRGQITMLLDEPDRSLDVTVQYKLWRTIFPNMAKEFQIIVATHCPFAVNVPGANYIELNQGYLDECRQVVSKL